MKPEKKFYPQLNVIKAIASFSVTAVHFRNRVETNIPESVINNKVTLFFSTNYALFIFAVPLFLLATGFLSVHKSISKKHFLNVFKIYSLYLFMAFLSHGLMIFTNTRDPMSLIQMIKRALSFSLISGWYIELYIALALIIPFLNVLIKNLSKKELQLLIGVLLFSVSIPAFINDNPDFSILYLPNYWKIIYPVVYYFIGAYICLYHEEISIKNHTLIFMYVTSIVYIIQLLYRYASPYTKIVEGYYPSIINVILASSFFLILFKNIKKSHYIFDIISKYTLSTYIMAYPIDKILYPRFMNIFTPTKNLILVSPFIVIVSFFATLISGIILNNLFNYFWRHIERFIKNPLF